MKQMVLLDMAQALFNIPGDMWGFTEVWGKATWDVVKANIHVFLPKTISVLDTYTLTETFPALS